MSLENVLESLADNSAEVAAGDFIELSDLSPEELGLFARTWFSTVVERQRWIISKMKELAEDNPELHFSAIFKMCLKDQDEVVLGIAMEGLWEHEDRSIIPILVQILHSENGPRVRSAAAVALGKFSGLVQERKLLPKDGEAIHDSLMAVLKDPDQHVDVRRRSLEAIAPFNTGDIKKFVSGAYGSPDLALKSSSIYAMGVPVRLAGCLCSLKSSKARSHPFATRRPTPVGSWGRRMRSRIWSPYSRTMTTMFNWRV